MPRSSASRDVCRSGSGPGDAPDAFINPDITIYLHRLPITEWVCLEAVTRVEPHGMGLAESGLWDERGVIGRSLQSLLVDRPS